MIAKLQLILPPGGAARLFSAHPPFRWAVVAAPEAARARPECVLERGEVTAIITHDEGVTWPDARGVALADGVLHAGGVAVFAFASLADAMAFKARLEGGTR